MYEVIWFYHLLYNLSMKYWYRDVKPNGVVGPEAGVSLYLCPERLITASERENGIEQKPAARFGSYNAS